jgi:3-oxoacid CoA-transferase
MCRGLGILLQSKQVKKMISSYVGENSEFERQYLGGELELELTPQGTLAEKLRCGGAGIPAFYTRTALGTNIQLGGFPIKYGADKKPVIVSKAKEVKQFNGQNYVMEGKDQAQAHYSTILHTNASSPANWFIYCLCFVESIRGDVGLVKAWKADTFGNLIFRGTAANFNPDVATAARYTIAEVEEIVPEGSFQPDQIHVPGVYIKAIIQANVEKKIEKQTFLDPSGKTGIAAGDKNNSNDKAAEQRELIVRRAALELQHGMNVNLGIGMPTLASNYLPKGVKIMLQSENGLLGMGPYPTKESMDPDLINAGKETITTLPGSSIFSSSQSFAMIRGGHVDISILGAMEVSEFGDLANWIIPGKLVKGMGGAMDLVSSGSYIVVVMEHANKGIKPKILKQCNLPVTGLKCVNRIITELCVFDVDSKKGLTLIELASGVTVEQVKKVTEAPFALAQNIKTIQYSA